MRRAFGRVLIATGFLALPAALLATFLASCGSPAAVTINSFTVGSASLTSAGGNDMLTWTGASVTAYTLSVAPGVGVDVNSAAYSGPVDLGTDTSAAIVLPANATGNPVVYTFTLTASGASGTPDTATTTVTVAASSAPSIASFSASAPSLASAGGSDSLGWSGSNVTDYVLSVTPVSGVTVNGGAYSGPVHLLTAISSQVTLPANATGTPVTYTFTLTANGAGGTTPDSDSTTITVAGVPGPAIGSFSANVPNLTSRGGSDILNWTGSNVSGYTLSVTPSTGVRVNYAAYTGPVDLGAATSATITVPGNTSASVTTSYVFTLTAGGASGTTPDTAQTTVTVATVVHQYYSTAGYQFSGPGAVAIDGDGNAWVTNYLGGATTGIMAADPATPVVKAYGTNNAGVSIDTSNRVWLADLGGDEVLRLMPPSYGAAGYGQGSGYPFYFPRSLAVDGSDNVWVYNLGNNLGPLSVVELLAPNYTSWHTYSAAAYDLDGAYGIAIDASGNAWVTNYANDSVTMIPAATPATPQVFSGAAFGFSGPYGIAVDVYGNVWVSNFVGNSVTVLPAGHPGTPGVYSAAAYGFDGPRGVAVDGSGNVWVANYAGDSVTVIPTASRNAPLVYADSAFHFNAPQGIAVDASGNVWVTDYVGNTVSVLDGVATGLPFSVPLGQ